MRGLRSATNCDGVSSRAGGSGEAGACGSWRTAAAGGGVIEDAPLAELAALLRLADQHVADAAELLGEAVELRDRLRLVILQRSKHDG